VPSDLEEETWETVKDHHPTAVQCSSTYSDLMKAALATVFWEIMNCLPCSPRDLNFFGSMKVHLGGQNFQTDDKHSVLNWLHSLDKTFCAVDVSNLPGQFNSVPFLSIF
jgi:hypothetical protein